MSMKYFYNFNDWKRLYEEVEPQQPAAGTQSQNQTPQTPQPKKEVKIGDRFEVKDATSNKTHQLEIVGPKLEDGAYDDKQNFIEAKIDQKGPYKLDKKEGGKFGGYQPEGGQMSGELVVQRPIELVGGKRSFEVIAKERKGGKRLDYTTLAKEEIWQGENYNTVWKPAVKKAMDNPDNFKSIVQYLKDYNGQDAATVKRYVANAEAKEKQKAGGMRQQLEKLATDGKIGPFHSIIRDVIESVTKTEIKPKPEDKPTPTGGTSSTTTTEITPTPPNQPVKRKRRPRDSDRAGESGTTTGGPGDWRR